MTTTPAAPLERLYDIRELQDAGYGDRTTLYRLIKTHKLAAVRVGGKIKVPASALSRIAMPYEG